MIRPFYALDSFEPSRSLGYLIKRVAKLSTSQIEARFEGRELTLSHWIALAMVHHGLVDNCARLSRQIGHNSGATTRLVDQLEARGLLLRTPCPSDRRVAMLACTPAGADRLAALTPILMGFWNEVLADFDSIEVETLINLLFRLVGALEAKEAAGEAVAA